MIIALVLMFLLFCISTFICFRFAIIILNIKDIIEDSLDVLDEKYESINEILNIPLFYDSREVRKVLSDLKEARQAVEFIADSLNNSTNIGNRKTDNDQ